MVAGRNANRGKQTVAEIRAKGGRADYILTFLVGEPAPQMAEKGKLPGL
ncbi:hypothetical protein [Bacillus sp. EB600]|nr:hypothetical protein [Bacillus sp. EB600]MCQ6282940.1 hypothetical protein [Bacillus sp. EB600]